MKSFNKIHAQKFVTIFYLFYFCHNSNYKQSISANIMSEELEVKELDQVVVRFSGDSGDGMQ